MTSSSPARRRRKATRAALTGALLCLPLWAQPKAETPGLSIVEAVVSQYEDAPPPGPSYRHYPGETIYLAFRIQGYQREEKQDERSFVKLSWRVELRDGADRLVVAPGAGKVEGELAEQDKEWKPKQHWQALLPPLMPSGGYKLTITLTDEYARRETSRTLSVPVSGYDVEPSPELTVRNIRYYRSEPNAQTPPLEKAVYRRGDVLWALFDITGYRFGANNRFEVTYGIEVLRADGSRVFQQEEAARLAEANFYPKRAVPGTFSLTVSPDVAPGTYTVVLRVRDVVGNQSFESRSAFVVE